MRPDEWRQVLRIVETALELPAAQRQAFIDQHCAGHEQLRQAIERLLDTQDHVDDFLQAPPLAAGCAPDQIGATQQLAGQRIGTYRLLRIIGSGGMGTVYLACRDDQQFDKQVAVKLCRYSLHPDMHRRFVQERQVLADLEHPGIARLLDGGQTADAQPYLVMEYVEGQPITTYCDRQRLSIDQRLLLFAEVCAAVQYAHERLIVHRDLKPPNILVTTAGRAKLLDFGISKLLDLPDNTAPVDTSPLLQPMTPQYCSPELMRGSTVTLASDVYALALILYELLCGHRPYELGGQGRAESLSAVEKAHIQRPSTKLTEPGRAPGAATPPGRGHPDAIAQARRTDPAQLRRLLLGDLDTIVMKGLHREVSGRYATVSALLEDLGRYRRHEPISARPTGRFYRAGKFVQRHRGPVIGAALAIAGLLATAIGTGVGFIQAREAEALARGNLGRARLAEQQTQQLLAESYVQAATLARQRGQWTMVQENLENARQAGYADDVDLRLRLLEAYHGLQRDDLLVEELNFLKKRQDVGDHRGTLLLWQAEYLLPDWTSQSDALDLIQQAMDAGLSPADNAYARGMLATTTPQAITDFDAALRLDPFHYRAHLMLAITLLTSGRLEEARLQVQRWGGAFPEDPYQQIILALICAYQQDPRCVESTIAELTGKLAESELHLVHAIVNVGQEISAMFESPTPQKQHAVISEVLKAFVKVSRHGSMDMRNLDGLFGFPRCLQTFAKARHMAWTILFSEPAETADLLAPILKCHPEGALYWIHGHLLVACDRLEEAEQALLRAVETPSILRIREWALMDTIRVQSLRRHDVADEETRSRVIGSIERLLSAEKLLPIHLLVAADGAPLAGRPDLALEIALRWRRRHPGDDEALRRRALAELETGACAAALRTAGELLAANPEDELGEKIRATALARLQHQVQQADETTAITPPETPTSSLDE